MTMTKDTFPVLRRLSIFDPMTYGVDGFRWVVLQGVYPLSNIITDVSVLVFFALVTTVLSIWLFKSTIE